METKKFVKYFLLMFVMVILSVESFSKTVSVDLKPKEIKKMYDQLSGEEITEPVYRPSKDEENKEYINNAPAIEMPNSVIVQPIIEVNDSYLDEPYIEDGKKIDLRKMAEEMDKRVYNEGPNEISDNGSSDSNDGGYDTDDELDLNGVTVIEY